MARLARYADTLRRSPGAEIDDASRRAIPKAALKAGALPPRSALASVPRLPPTASTAPLLPLPVSQPMPSPVTHPAPLPVATPAPLVAPPAPPRPSPNRYVISHTRFLDVRMSVLGQLLGVAGCAAAVLAFISLSTLPAFAVVLVALAVGVAGIVGRRAFAWWWTIGVVVGALLGRFS
jgi:hypothetical protein